MFFLNKGKKEQEVLQRQDLRPMMETESMNMQVPHLSTGITWSCVAYGWRRQWHPTPVLLPGKSHGWRSLGGFSPWGRWGSDTTERLHFHFSLWCIGEGHGNPLQCSCLENPGAGEPGGLPSMGLHRVRHDWSDLAADLAATIEKFYFHKWEIWIAHKMNSHYFSFHHSWLFHPIDYSRFWLLFTMFFLSFFLYFVLVIPYINMNPPQVYTYSPSWTPLPIPSFWVVPVHQPRATSIMHQTWTGDSFHIWYYTCFNAILPNHPNRVQVTFSFSHLPPYIWWNIKLEWV